MPKTLVLEDGSEVEVSTDEELKALQDKAKTADDLSKQVDAIKAEKIALEEGVNPNWPEVRKDLKRKDSLEKALKEKGLVYNEDGSISDNPNKKQVTQDEVDVRATKAATEVIFKNHIDSRLLQFDKDTQAAIKQKYSKLSAGETLSGISDIEKILGEAIQIVSPKSNPIDPQRRGGFHGGVPNFASNNEVTVATREIGNSFGLSEKDYEKTGDVSNLLLSK